VLTGRHWLGVGAYGAVMTACALGAHACASVGLGYGEARAITVAFLTLAFAQVLHVFNMRDRGTRFVRNEVTRSPWVWGAVGLCVVLLLAAVYVDPLSRVLRLPPPDARGWLVIALGASIAPLFFRNLFWPR
jgi:Ca2+-transporting ATPase